MVERVEDAFMPVQRVRLHQRRVDTTVGAIVQQMNVAPHDGGVVGFQKHVYHVFGYRHRHIPRAVSTSDSYYRHSDEEDNAYD